MRHVLLASGQLTCCAHDETHSLVLGGTREGSVVLWELSGDTRESQRLAMSRSLGLPRNTVRRHTCSTDEITSMETHDRTICRVMFLATGDRVRRTIASVDERGVLIVWRLYRQGSSMCLDKLSRVSSFHTPTLKYSVASDLTCEDETSSTFLIGTSRGDIVRTSRFDDILVRPPRRFHRNEVIRSLLTSSSVAVTSLSMSPFPRSSFSLACKTRGYVLASFEDGCISLYDTFHAAPLRTWYTSSSTKETKALRVRWSSSVPGVFFALLARGELQTWDLLQRHDGPIMVDDLHEIIKTERVVLFDVNGRDVCICGSNGDVVRLRLRACLGRCSDMEGRERSLSRALRYLPL